MDSSNIYENLRCRKYTPLECFRLMGFTDEDFFEAKNALIEAFYNGEDRANSRLYKMAGNSIAIPMLEQVLIKIKCGYKRKEGESPIKLLSLFSGIGAFEKALNNIGVLFDLVAYCEFDKYVSKAYSAIHKTPESMNLGDITKLDEKGLPKDIDLVTYGFPCQPFSTAGKKEGFGDSKGRGNLFFDALRVIRHCEPKICIAENVKGLTSPRFKNEFQTILQSLNNVGYNNYWKLIDAKDCGIAQHRERVIVVSIRKDIDMGCFEFPEPIKLQKSLYDYLDPEVDEKYYIPYDKAKAVIPRLKNKMISNTIRTTGNGSLDSHQWDLVCVRSRSDENGR